MQNANTALTKAEELANSICAGSAINRVFNDYDDYGVQQYVQIKGECASLIIEAIDNHGTLQCRVECLRTEDESTTFTYPCSGIVGGIATTNHFSQFVTKEHAPAVEAYDIECITQWIEEHAKFLTATSELFFRHDYINYPDLRGTEKWGNGQTSFDVFRVADEDFYTGTEIKSVRREKLPPAC